MQATAALQMSLRQSRTSLSALAVLAIHFVLAVYVQVFGVLIFSFDLNQQMPGLVLPEVVGAEYLPVVVRDCDPKPVFEIRHVTLLLS